MLPSCSASEMVGRVADRAVQIHGGAGYMRTTGRALLSRRPPVPHLEGTSQIQQLIIAREMLERMSHSLGIVIADDFTGALMVAGYIEGAGIYCPVVFAPSAVVPGSPVIVGGTWTRTVPVTDALVQFGPMAEAFVSSGYRRLAYKACATFVYRRKQGI